MKKALLVGNGINMLESRLSWNKMLEDIISNMGKSGSISFDDKPYPLLYEEIFTKGMRYTNYDEKKIKEEIFRLTQTLKHNKYHEKLMNLPIENILTTNYDYCLEEAYNGIEANKNHERKYSLFRKRTSEDKTFWHLHGELDHNDSLMLGYEHYAGALQKMRNYMTSGISVQGKQYRSPFNRGIMKFEQEDHYSWLDIFLRDEIHIVGFGFGFDEIDLWWLLSYRNRIMLEKKVKCGNIYYHYFTRGEDGEKAKLDMLKVLGVELKAIELDRKNGEWQYKSAWDTFFTEMGA